jgi:hypothetical protein
LTVIDVAVAGGEAGLHQIAFGSDDAPRVVEIEGPVARIGECAIRHQDLEKAVTADRRVETVSGRGQIAL